MPWLLCRLMPMPEQPVQALSPLHYLLSSSTFRDASLKYTAKGNSQNHGIIEWFGLDETLKITSFQPPCHGQEHLPLDQVAERPIEPGPEHCQGGGSHSFSGQPVPVPHHPHYQKCHSFI